jgi:hypothetical protein
LREIQTKSTTAGSTPNPKLPTQHQKLATKNTNVPLTIGKPTHPSLKQTKLEHHHVNKNRPHQNRTVDGAATNNTTHNLLTRPIEPEPTAMTHPS